MRLVKLLSTVLVAATALLCAMSASAQQIRFFPDFSSVANLQLNGAYQATYNSAKVLRLTDGAPAIGTNRPDTGTAWFNIQQPVNAGFTTYFKFQIDLAGLCCTPGDGLAFVIQNGSTDSSYGATGAGLTARGVGSGGLGYAGILNSLAVEFDTATNLWDPNNNHVAVQGCGTQTNGPVHIPGTFTIGSNHNVTSCLVGSGINSAIPHLGATCGTSGPCADGRPHEVVIEYTPPANGIGNGTLVVWIDQPFIPGTHTPCPSTTIPGCPVAAVAAINIPYNIDNAQNSQGISLAGGTSAWVGFTASQTSFPQAHDILAWEFTPHTPAQVTQVIPPGTTTAEYVFGGHDMGVKFFDSFVNDPDPFLMTVTATPVPRSVFYQTRLLTQSGVPFKNEQCVVYLQTGGNCVVYSVTCARQSNPNLVVPCPTAPQCTTLGDKVNCITFDSSFYTADGITKQNADYLKTDPVGSNNWVSIFVNYDPNVLDGKTTGTGGSSSDFVVTLKAFSKP